ncbi:MAG: hypothetical protein U0L19_11060 [Bacteroidales bacterium]|nr:hypothetical protein [Bacteroidales bacterium]
MIWLDYNNNALAIAPGVKCSFLARWRWFRVYWTSYLLAFSDKKKY